MVLEQSASANVATDGVPVASPHRVMHPPSPCASPRGSGPFEPLQPPIANAAVPVPPRAQAEHVAGCAGLRFRIGQDGIATDVTLVAEYPLGYGFGEAGLHKLRILRWSPRDDLAWHYLVVNWFPKPNA